MKSEKIFYIISITAAVLYLVLLPVFHPYPLSYLLKITPLLSLSIVIMKNTIGKQRILILLAIIFCMTGDVLFDLDRNANFKLGLVAFLTGHIFYIIVFLLNRKIEKSRLPYIIAILIYSLMVGFFLRNIDPDFLIPVFAYLTVISVMTISAFLMKDFSWVIAIGAVIFMFSDTIIAINKFLITIPNSTVYNIALYFIAQIMIIRGLVKQK